MAKSKSIHKPTRRSSTPEYFVWYAARARCRNPNSEFYHRYGGRGINVCERWNKSFDAFLADMGTRPTPKHSIDRKDNDKGYWCGKTECPECGPLKREPNCRWATAKEQHRNVSYNVRLTHNGETLTVTEWAERLGTKIQIIVGRLELGWSLEEALTTPPGEVRKSLKTRPCQHCGVAFTCTKLTEASQRLFCSVRCRKQNYLPRAREVYAQKKAGKFQGKKKRRLVSSDTASVLRELVAARGD